MQELASTSPKGRLFDFLTLWAYWSNGLCENCPVVVRGRLANCLKRRLRNVGVVEDFSEALGECVSRAREIIRLPPAR
jgi:hypothetical protein